MQFQVSLFVAVLYWQQTRKRSIYTSMVEQKKKKQKNKADKEMTTKVILMTDEETDEEDIDEEEEDEGGMYFEKEDVRLIYNALKNYKPTDDELALYEAWLEMFEEMLVVDYGVKLPGFEDMDDEDE